MITNKHSMNLRNGKIYICSNDNHKEPIIPINNSNKCLSDFQLQFYFDTFFQEISKNRKDVWFFSPSMTHILKLGSLFDVRNLMTDINFNSVNYPFICISSGNAGLEPSSHWSLMIYCKLENKIFYLNSIKGSTTIGLQWML